MRILDKGGTAIGIKLHWHEFVTNLSRKLRILEGVPLHTSALVVGKGCVHQQWPCITRSHSPGLIDVGEP
jgi:hypothetical protein